jgi:hypothetical protein
VWRGDLRVIGKICATIQNSFSKLKEEDGSLFECPIEVEALYDSRKLHEVCINHRLANHLEDSILPLLVGNGEKYFVDIEFDREGKNFKDTEIDGQKERVRPDIIIHNRKSGDGKDNFLVVECKKDDAEDYEKEYDTKKIIALLVDDKYSYQFGLQVIYSKTEIEGTLFFIDNGAIEEVTITV